MHFKLKGQRSVVGHHRRFKCRLHCMGVGKRHCGPPGLCPGIGQAAIAVPINGIRGIERDRLPGFRGLVRSGIRNRRSVSVLVVVDRIVVNYVLVGARLQRRARRVAHRDMLHVGMVDGE